MGVTVPNCVETIKRRRCGAELQHKIHKGAKAPPTTEYGWRRGELTRLGRTICVVVCASVGVGNTPRERFHCGDRSTTFHSTGDPSVVVGPFLFFATPTLLLRQDVTLLLSQRPILSCVAPDVGEDHDLMSTSSSSRGRL